jgi:predicted PilT family ATPase
MRTGDELALDAMKNEHKRLCRRAAKAAKDADEYMEITTEALAIHEEFATIVKSGEHGEAVLKKLDDLTKRRDRVERILKKDLITLLDKQSEAECERDRLAREISIREFNISHRKAC